MVPLKKVVEKYFKIRLFLKKSLVFCFIAYSCATKKSFPIEIEWKGKQAVAIVIPKDALGFIPAESFAKLLQVNVAGNSTPILGDFIEEGQRIIFRPLLSLTRGLTYEIKANGKEVDQIKIPLSENPPQIVTVYPQLDSVPVNLLKIYILFSNPMQEGTALQNISLIKNTRDTVRDAFLDLQQELWNHDRTLLTIWLDPGRIKRDLIPNKTMGPPLEQGYNYEILIHKDWKDETGAGLGDDYRKKFFTSIRDSLPPRPESWLIISPPNNSSQPLQIDFHEPLDYVLIENAIHILNGDRNPVHGKMQIKKDQAALIFTPDQSWTTGKYFIEIEARLEDLAGNNLNHPFDNDLFVQKHISNKEIVTLSFEVK